MCPRLYSTDSDSTKSGVLLYNFMAFISLQSIYFISNRFYHFTVSLSPNPLRFYHFTILLLLLNVYDFAAFLSFRSVLSLHSFFHFTMFFFSIHSIYITWKHSYHFATFLSLHGVFITSQGFLFQFTVFISLQSIRITSQCFFHFTRFFFQFTAFLSLDNFVLITPAFRFICFLSFLKYIFLSLIQFDLLFLCISHLCIVFFSNNSFFLLQLSITSFLQSTGLVLMMNCLRHKNFFLKKDMSLAFRYSIFMTDDRASNIPWFQQFRASQWGTYIPSTLSRFILIPIGLH